MSSWAIISRWYPGWTLSEIKDLTPRERMNWAEITINGSR